MVILNEKSYKAITNSDGVMSTGNAFYVRFKLSDYVIHKQKMRREKKKATKTNFRKSYLMVKSQPRDWITNLSKSQNIQLDEVNNGLK